MSSTTAIGAYSTAPKCRPNSAFTRRKILPVTSGEVATISFWEHEGNADAYDSGGYPEVLKILGRLLDGAPYVKTFEVVSSTFHRHRSAKTEEKENVMRQVAPAQPGYPSCETTV